MTTTALNTIESFATNADVTEVGGEEIMQTSARKPTTEVVGGDVKILSEMYLSSREQPCTAGEDG